MSNRPPLGVHLRGPALWVVWQLLRESFPVRIGQLARDPHVPGDVVGHLRGTLADLELGAQLFRDWQAVRNAAESADRSLSGSDAGLGNPPQVGVAEVAVMLNCGPRWVTTLCRTGQLAATKHGREWRIDVSSVEDFKRRGVYAA